MFDTLKRTDSFESFIWQSDYAVCFRLLKGVLLCSFTKYCNCLIYWETLSLLLFKLRNYGFDELVSRRYWHHLFDKKIGFRGTCVPWRNVRGWLYDGAWERWRIVCLAALSVEDIEDIYLFGTMITDLLLIGLGFALGYRRIQKTGTAVQSLTRLPVMTEAVGRAVSIETETINRNMDSIMEKLTALQKKIDDIRDQNGQRE